MSRFKNGIKVEGFKAPPEKDLEQYSEEQRTILSSLRNITKGVAEIYREEVAYIPRWERGARLGLEDHQAEAIADICYDNRPGRYNELIDNLSTALKAAAQLGLGDLEMVTFYAQQLKIKLPEEVPEQTRILGKLEEMAGNVRGIQRRFEAAKRRAGKPVLGIDDQLKRDVDDLTYDAEMAQYNQLLDQIKETVTRGKEIGLDFPTMKSRMEKAGMEIIDG